MGLVLSSAISQFSDMELELHEGLLIGKAPASGNGGDVVGDEYLEDEELGCHRRTTTTYPLKT